MRLIHILCIFVLASIASQAHATQVYFDVASTEINRLDTFYLPIRIDPQGECINAVEMAISYDPSEVSVRDIATGDSIITLWAEPPSIKKVNGVETGQVTFGGGIPGGYCGRVEGDPGLSNILIKLVVQGVAKPPTVDDKAITNFIVEPSTKVYLNDGDGTESELTVLGATLSLVQSTATPDDVWKQDIDNDETSPEYFEILLVTGPSEGSPYHYIVFSTTDKQSGIDHYEVFETDPDRFGLLSWLQRPAYWTIATSPYVLRDQSLHSKILVKAVDKKGNERISEYTPPMSPFLELTRASVLIPIVVVVGLLAVLIAFVLRIHKKPKKKDDINKEQIDTQSDSKTHE